MDPLHLSKRKVSFGGYHKFFGTGDALGDRRRPMLGSTSSLVSHAICPGPSYLWCIWSEDSPHSTRDYPSWVNPIKYSGMIPFFMVIVFISCDRLTHSIPRIRQKKSEKWEDEAWLRSSNPTPRYFINSLSRRGAVYHQSLLCRRYCSSHSWKDRAAWTQVPGTFPCDLLPVRVKSSEDGWCCQLSPVLHACIAISQHGTVDIVQSVLLLSLCLLQPIKIISARACFTRNH